FFALAAALVGVAFAAERRARGYERELQSAREAAKRSAIRRPEMALGLVGVDALAVEVGAELAALLAPPLADALLDRIGEVRRALAGDLGIVLPGVRLRDDLAREPASYAIRVRDVIAAEGTLRLGAMLAVGEPALLAQLAGERVREPVYALEASWIAPAARERAVELGTLVFDPISVLGSHLAEIARLHAAELLGRQELHTVIEHLRASIPSLCKELGTEGLPMATVHRVFELLLRERIWPRDIVATLQALVDAAPLREAGALAEAVRRTLVPSLLRRRRLAVLEALVLEPAFESELAGLLVDGTLAPQPQLVLHLRASLAAYVQRVPRERAALLCTSPLRAALAEFVRRFGFRLDVYAFAELPPELEIRPALAIERPPLPLAASA
ncbi:MAG: FHIPEP family type III secretion protein, partial [Vulcanimicrobiaceae bacterium]